MKSLRTNAHRKLVDSLRDCRISASMTQQRLAEELRVPQSWVSKIETGERKIDVIEFITWMKACGSTDQIDNLISDLIPDAGHQSNR